jgi:choline dehydrogenase-like flavoprotein
VLAAGAPRSVPSVVLEAVAERAVGWWVSSEDLPHPDNRVRFSGDQVVLEYQPRHTGAFERLKELWKQTLARIDPRLDVLPHSIYVSHTIPLEGIGHQCGTCVFGDDPRRSVLDRNCQSHEVRGLYVVDGSFFPSSSAVNPALTIIANALRVGDVIARQLGARSRS